MNTINITYMYECIAHVRLIDFYCGFHEINTTIKSFCREVSEMNIIQKKLTP